MGGEAPTLNHEAGRISPWPGGRPERRPLMRRWMGTEDGWPRPEPWLDVWMAAWRRRLQSFATAYVHDSSLAEDITQETFVRLYEWRTAHPNEEIRPGWLFTVAYRLAVDQARAKRRFMAHLARLPDAPPVDPELRTLVRDLVARLPVRDRCAVWLYYYQDLSLAEVAAAMRTTPAEVKSRLHRARRRLARAWQGDTP